MYQRNYFAAENYCFATKMARMGPKVLVGYEDESITDKYKSLVNFTTNKIGGKPNWPVEGVPSPLCQLCGLSLPLILQIYAPLENSTYHRTLYLFGCINPNCWNQNDSWVCVRSQILEISEDTKVDTSTVNTQSVTDWCSDADDWEDDNNINNNEENGNVIGRLEGCGECFSEDEDETEDFEDDDTVVRFGNLRVEERNANWNAGSGYVMAGAEAQGGGAVGRLHSPSATAEIEGDESEVVSIDTPTAPQHDLLALLQEVTPLPVELCSTGYSDKHGCVVSSKVLPPQFNSFFIYVAEEGIQDMNPNTTQEHVRELLQEYSQTNEEGLNLSPDQEKRGASGHGDNPTLEKYEKGVPLHGDEMLHEFALRIKANPTYTGILRYSYGREGSPLLLSPLLNPPTRCRHCRSDMMFEFQLLPTLLANLTLSSVSGRGAHLEFGTVLVYTCQRSCWASGDTVREEAVVVQAERI